MEMTSEYYLNHIITAMVPATAAMATVLPAAATIAGTVITVTEATEIVRQGVPVS